MENKNNENSKKMSNNAIDGRQDISKLMPIVDKEKQNKLLGSEIKIKHNALKNLKLGFTKNLKMMFVVVLILGVFSTVISVGVIFGNKKPKKHNSLGPNQTIPYSSNAGLNIFSKTLLSYDVKWKATDWLKKQITNFGDQKVTFNWIPSLFNKINNKYNFSAKAFSDKKNTTAPNQLIYGWYNSDKLIDNDSKLSLDISQKQTANKDESSGKIQLNNKSISVANNDILILNKNIDPKIISSGQTLLKSDINSLNGENILDNNQYYWYNFQNLGIKITLSFLDVNGGTIFKYSANIPLLFFSLKLDSSSDSQSVINIMKNDNNTKDVSTFYYAYLVRDNIPLTDKNGKIIQFKFSKE